MTFFYHESFNYFLHGESFDTLVHKHVYLHKIIVQWRQQKQAAIRQVRKEMFFLLFYISNCTFLCYCVLTLSSICRLYLSIFCWCWLHCLLLSTPCCTRFMWGCGNKLNFLVNVIRYNQNKEIWWNDDDSFHPSSNNKNNNSKKIL